MKAKILKEQIELFGEWKNLPLHKEKVFIEDGIIDIDRYLSSEKRIMLFLKEAYGEEENWNLADIIRDNWKGPKYKVFWTASYWIYLLNTINHLEIPLFPSSEEKLDACRNYLLSSAIVNVKKSNGESLSTHEDIMEYALHDKKLILKQIRIIDPQIILCGNTKEFFDIVWDRELRAVEKTEFIYESDGKIIIDYWHPSNLYPDKLCYYALGTLYQRILRH